MESASPTPPPPTTTTTTTPTTTTTTTSTTATPPTTTHFVMFADCCGVAKCLLLPTFLTHIRYGYLAYMPTNGTS